MEFDIQHQMKVSDAVAEKSKESSSFSRYSIIAGFVILLFAALLRFHDLGERSLWTDEAQIEKNSRGTLYDVLKETRVENSAPLMHPYILYIAHKFGHTPYILRVPSALASTIAVFIMLSMIRVQVSHIAALFAASMMTLASSQIRYAQEIHGYALCIMFATMLLFYFLKWESNVDGEKHPLVLYLLLFLAPFVQYGLVLFAACVVLTMGLLSLVRNKNVIKTKHAIISVGCLGIGSAITFYLTMRFQLGVGTFFLASYYFDPRSMHLLDYLNRNTWGFFNFVLPGDLVTKSFLVTTLAYLLINITRKKIDALCLLTIISVAALIICGLVRLFPYGGTRHCLFLSPVVILFAGTVFTSLLQPIRSSICNLIIIFMLCIIILSGIDSILTRQPYAEVEDMKTVLQLLNKLSKPADQIYVYYGARFAWNYYHSNTDSQYFIGGKHRENPELYVPELLSSVRPETNRLWLVFAHYYRREREWNLITAGLNSDWIVKQIVAPNGAALYVADRRN